MTSAPPSARRVIAFKLAARARKLANEECVVEGYELLLTAVSEAAEIGDLELHTALCAQQQRFEQQWMSGD